MYISTPELWCHYLLSRNKQRHVAPINLSAWLTICVVALEKKKRRKKKKGNKTNLLLSSLWMLSQMIRVEQAVCTSEGAVQTVGRA